MKVNIYLETDKQCQACIQRKYGYVIEIMYHGQIVTREGFGCVVSTYHQCNLQALAEALARFHSSCEICIHTKDTFVASRVLRISDLAAVDFKERFMSLSTDLNWRFLHQPVHIHIHSGSRRR